MKQICLIFLLFLTLPSLSYSIDIKRVCLNDGDVTVYWSKLNDTCDDFQDYTVYWQQSSGDNFNQLFTVGDYNVTSITDDPGNTGNFDEWRYYVVGEYECGGTTVTEVSDTIGIDSDPPSTISLDSITVADGQVELGWSSHSDDDIQGYNIYYIDENGNTRLLDTVMGRFNTAYVDDSLSDPEDGAENFSIGAFDSCNNGSPISNETHSTVFLNIDSDSCQGRAELSWTSYEGWNVDHYKVILEDPDGNREELGQLGSDEFSYTITSSDVEDDVQYEVFIRAVSADDNTVTSSSNRVNFSNNILQEPDYVYLRNVTVDDGAIRIEWLSDNAQDVGTYEIYRSQTRSGFSRIGTVNASGEEEGLGSYTDYGADPGRTEYYYRVRAIDICGQFVERSNISNSIHLRVRNSDNRSILRWNHYEFWEGSVSHYNIYRSIDTSADVNWERIDQVSYTQLEYDDTTSIERPPEEGICYRVEAVEGDGNEIGPSAQSQSNVVCFYREAVVYVPNAFRPEGETNTVFRPSGLFIDYERSEMHIYNRWGEEVYFTEGIEKGWDGTNQISGGLADQGVYLYMIRLIGKDGQTDTYKGTITLLR